MVARPSLRFALSHPAHFLAFGFGSGLAPFAPGTFGTLLALPIFWWAGQILWAEAFALGAGFVAGGALGARAAVRGGERIIKPVLAVAVVVLAGRMLGLY